jgi:SAM-dependent methyltransferase
MSPPTPSAHVLKEVVRTKYRAIAKGTDSCCGPSSSCGPDADLGLDVSDHYGDAEDIAAEADLNLGCGRPTQYADLQPGERVLDLGSGAGMDAFVARRDVGTEGHVHGVDITEEMVTKARTNADKLGHENVTFAVGDIEALPVEDDSFDVALSNCVLNLVPDKAQAFAEIARVLRPGGRFAISDIVRVGTLPDPLREAAELHVGCVAGAMERADYLALIREAGFEDVMVGAEKTVDLPDALLEKHLDPDARRAFQEDGGTIQSITVTGRSPAR